jgi:predicted transcriptional regulator
MKINPLEAHQKFLQAQSEKHPTLTLQEMGRLIGVESHSHVTYILENLIREGLAEKIERGKKNVYRILRSNQ